VVSTAVILTAQLNISNMNFDQMGLIAPISKAIAEEGYSKATPIQEQAIPIVMRQTDLLGCAQTGTGKTAAFAIPILQLLEGSTAKSGIKVLILTPTRELAIQIHESFAAYGRYCKSRAVVIFGGVPQGSQVTNIRKGCDVLIATPGRLLDLMGQGIISIKQLQIFVLDEADRMLDMGFVHDVKRIIKHLPEKRQTLFFSATMPSQIKSLADSLLKNPEIVTVTPVNSTVDVISQQVLHVAKADKPKLLLHLLNTVDMKSVLVFARTKHGSDKIVKILKQANLSVAAIHGNKSQNARQAALKDFKNGSLKILIATDIAARGIDIDELGHVINYELPEVPETYVHRIGRTGRAGHSGRSFSFCDGEEAKYLKEIQKFIGKVIPVNAEHPYVDTTIGIKTVSIPSSQGRKPQQQSTQRGGQQQRQSPFKSGGGQRSSQAGAPSRDRMPQARVAQSQSASASQQEVAQQDGVTGTSAKPNKRRFWRK
jgi:ATP-dependent RNA helicase RhlE